jgi:CheY-like chemotaxis protein
MKILCVDDDADDLDIFFQAIRETIPAAEIVTAGNGEEALNFLEQSRTLPDFIFLDINMPLMGGIECLTMIKASKEFRSLDVIVYSTTTSQKEIVTVTRLGARFLVKQPNYHKLVLDLAVILTARGFA